MKYLGYDHLGFDREALCFPALKANHAVCYVTDDGLFGFHNTGDGAKSCTVRNITGRFIREINLWTPRSEAFATFVRSHQKGISAAKRLYGVCFASGPHGREYGDSDPLEVWLDELMSFAKALNFTGQIWGYNLAEQTRTPMLNARFLKKGGACILQLKTFSPVETLKGPNMSSNDHRRIERTNKVDPPVYHVRPTGSRIVTTISDTGWQTLFPERLR